MQARLSQLQLTEQQRELYKKQLSDLQGQYSKLIDVYNTLKQYTDWLQSQYDLRNKSLEQAQLIFDLVNKSEFNNNQENITKDLNADLKKQFSETLDSIHKNSQASEKYAQLLKIYDQLERSSTLSSSEAELKQAALETEIRRAKKISQDKKKQKKQFKEQLAKLESEIKNLNNKLSKKTSNSELNDLTNNYRELIENLAQKNQVLQKELNVRSLQLENLQNEIENLKQQLDENELIKTINNLNLELKHSLEINNELNASLQNSAQDNQLLKEELNAKNELILRQKKEVKDQQATIKLSLIHI